jgi:amino acid adenylation domain-containing protein
MDLASQESFEKIDLPEVDNEDAAYIFFTSGTTGVPKGVLGCHKGLSHFLNWQRQEFGVGPHDRSAQLTGLSFDVVLRDIFLPLVSGATLCLPPADSDLGPAQILPWLEREKISLLHTVPSLAQTWLVNVPSEVSFSELRYVFFAGEPLTSELVRQWRDQFPQAGEIINLYGPTETTLAKYFYKVPDDILGGVQPVGLPLPETQGLILTQDKQLCGPGEAGEIVIRTPFRSLGYINAPEENEKRFINNPFNKDSQDVLYRSGDLGRYRLDGSVEILGRLDHQVKIRGVRIEPEEVQVALGQHPAVRQAVVIAREDVPGEKSLVAYVVSAGEQPPTVSGLNRFLKQRLPDPMRPSAFVMLDAIPLNPNGKVNRQALPAPDGARPELEETFVMPRTPVEEAIAGIWSDLLGVEQVGVYDNFFDLGGHSLIATLLISRMREVFQLELPLRSLFEAPAVAELAELILQDPEQRVKVEKNAQLFLRLAQLSEDDVARMLDEKKDNYRRQVK